MLSDSPVIGMQCRPTQDYEDVVGVIYDDLTGYDEKSRELLEKLRGRMFVFDPVDRGHESWSQCAELKRRLADLEGIFEPSRIFQVRLFKHPVFRDIKARCQRALIYIPP